MKTANVTILMLFGLVLSACSGSTSRPWDADWNPQSYAGITAVDARWSEATGKLERIQVFQGKGGESFDVDADLEKGTVSWKGKNVTVDGQKVRAAVEQAVSNDVKDVAPGIVDAITSSVVKALGIP